MTACEGWRGDGLRVRYRAYTPQRSEARLTAWRARETAERPRGFTSKRSRVPAAHTLYGLGGFASLVPTTSAPG